MIDADSDERGRGLGSTLSQRRYGTIEVRPVMDVHQ